MYKYRILYLLKKLSYEDYQISWEFFPQVLNISKSTWRRWIYIKKDNPECINSDHLITIARFFQCKIEDLLNTTVTEEHVLKTFQTFKNVENKKL